MKRTLIFHFILLLIFSNACNVSKKAGNFPKIILDEVEIAYNPSANSYRASRERKTDLIHTKLEVRFDWGKSRLYGIATLDLRPYFYPTNKLILDAKGFDINSIKLLRGDSTITLGYYYDSLQLDILLDKTYTRTDTYRVVINYIAKPEELVSGGSSAITSDKGLYFINPMGKDSLKPRQIWTQGETESSSCWFPTIDAPNEKTTQELYITVDNNFTTLSNGELLYSYFNPDDTRTDYWKQNKPHAPYLFMLTIGEFEVIKDKWRNKEVNYYVEKKYQPYAKEIFGNTPEMIEFYSTILGVDYPWDKYAQVVVRDYVSGAMENTGAVIHGAFLQQTHRELLDENHEDVIAHELFHHWFGDLVTCESWSNLPLNESFATYGEYLWIEYKYGKDAADYHKVQDMLSYKYSVSRSAKNLIRFYYDDKEDMFDAHSYQKGGLILHMLRNYVGDEAFFASLKKYLTDNAYQAVEIHQLRLAFEEVTGKDLNWFFNQWFLSKGHPKLNIVYTHSKKEKKVKLNIKQTQDKDWPVFELPVKVEIHLVDTSFSQIIIINKDEQLFEFDADTTVLLINFDVDDVLLAEVSDNFPSTWSAYKFNHASSFKQRYSALSKIKTKTKKTTAENQVIITALSYTFWRIRELAIEAIESQELADTCLLQLIYLVEKENNSQVRSAAIAALAEYGKFDTLKSLFEKHLVDSSYWVSAASLDAIAYHDIDLALTYAKEMASNAHSEQVTSVAEVFAEQADPKVQPYFMKAINRVSGGYQKYILLSYYSDYLEKSSDTVKLVGVEDFNTIVRGKFGRWLTYAAIKATKRIKTIWEEKKATLAKKMKKSAKDEIALEKIKSKISYYQSMIDKADEVLDFKKVTIMEFINEKK